jgi:hypothetical protein
MANKTAPAPAVEPIDVKEVVSHLDLSAGLLAHAEQSFVDVRTIFEAIKADALQGSLISRLSQLAINLTESLECDFQEYSARYSAHVERYSAALDGNPFRRVHSTEVVEHECSCT